MSAQPAIWNTAILRRFLVPGFSPWHFEQLGSQMSDDMREEFWGPFRATIVYEHGVEKGKWKPEGLRICREAGVEIDLNARPAFSEAEFAAHAASGVEANAAYALKAQAVASFRQGRRGAGMRNARAVARAGGSAVTAMAVSAFGILGPSALTALERWNVRGKVRRLRRDFERRVKGRR